MKKHEAKKESLCSFARWLAVLDVVLHDVEGRVASASGLATFSKAACSSLGTACVGRAPGDQQLVGGASHACKHMRAMIWCLTEAMEGTQVLGSPPWPLVYA